MVGSMVRLEKIVIQGFKSFKRKTSIPFADGFSVITGPNGAGKCVDGDTEIFLSTGVKKARDVVDSAFVNAKKVKRMDDGFYTTENPDNTSVVSLNPKTMKLEIKRISSFVKRKSPSEMIHIKTRYGKELITTPYHPVFTLTEEGDLTVLKAGELHKGLKIAAPRSLPALNKTRIDFNEYFDPEDMLYAPYSPSLKAAIRGVSRENGGHTALSKRLSLSEYVIKGLMDGQSINVSHLNKILSIGSFSRKEFINLMPQIKGRNQFKNVNSVWNLNKDMARFLAYMITEGRSTISNQLWFVNTEDALVNDFCEASKSVWGIEPKVFEYRDNLKDVILFSKPVATTLDKIFSLKVDSHSSEKMVPEPLFIAPRNIISEFMGSVIDGDGYISSKGKYIEISTKSKKLAKGLATLLLVLNVQSIINSKKKYATNTKNKTKRTYYFVYIYGTNNIARLKKLVNLKSKKEQILQEIEPSSSNPNLDLIPNINPLIKKLVKITGIKVKKNRRQCPKLAAYYENRCLSSREGLLEVIDVIGKKGIINKEAQKLIDKIKLIATSDILWDDIIEVKRIKAKDKWVYDFCIDVNHNFVAENLIVHNTNVSDSICFVLGKSSSKSLRAKKAHELIFHGSKKKEASDSASVTIYFDNSDSSIPINEKSVSIGRRINKNGVSTYRLNGKVVTRQQIVDIFSQAGIHTDGQNIIQQGDVTQIVEMDPQQRRVIIDDIAGITEYDEKKHKAEKELEKIGEKVREAEIVLHERESILERLQKDRDAALEYQKLESELNSLRAALLWKSYSDAETSLKEKAKTIEEKTKIADKLEKEIKEYDKLLENEEQTLENLTRDVIQASSQIEVTKKIAKLQAEIEAKKSKIESNQREIQRIDMMIDRLRSIDRHVSPEFKKILGFNGVHGFFSDLVMIPSKYSIAVDVAAGSHMRDIVVDNTNTAVTCVKYLKENKIGRARFLPLEKIRPYNKKTLPTGAMGWLSELIHHEPKLDNVVEYVLGTTACVKDIDKAKEIAKGTRVRMVTLDGDLIEASGAITGGYLRKKGKSSETDINKYMNDKKSLDGQSDIIERDLIDLKKQLEIHASKEKSTNTASIERNRVKFEENVKKVREARKEAYEKRLIIQQELGKLNIKRARLEADFDNYKTQLDSDKKTKEKGSEEFEKLSVPVIKIKQRETIEKIEALGPINMKAVEEFEAIKNEFVEFKEKVDRIVSEKESIEETINKIEEKKKVTFDRTLNEISKHFKVIYKEITNGEATLALADTTSLDSGLLIKASPQGKSLLSIDSMSGGEKTLTAFAFLFAIQNHKPKPFYILDEADSALDKTNTKKIVNLIKKQSKHAQFIIISHNDTLVKEADQVYGVTMEDGESKVMGIKLPDEN